MSMIVSLGMRGALPEQMLRHARASGHPVNTDEAIGDIRCITGPPPLTGSPAFAGDDG
jgi:hypothetical protein